MTGTQASGVRRRQPNRYKIGEISCVPLFDRQLVTRLGA
jgi:hypothetical protein